MIDDALREAASDLRAELQQVSPPPFKPRSQLGGRVLVVAATVAVFVAGFALLRNGAADIVESDLGPAEQTDETVSDPAGDPAGESLDEPVTDSVHRPASAMERPQRQQDVMEPEFGSVISAVSAAPSGGTVNPIPQGVSSWNADGSLIVLYESGTLNGEHVLYDGRTFARIGPLPLRPRDIEEVFWDPQRPDRIYYTAENRLLTFDFDPAVRAGGTIVGTETIVHEFAECDDVGAPRSAKPISTNGEMIGLVCLDPATGEAVQWLALDLAAGDEWRATAEGGSTPLPFPDGSRFVVVSGDGLVRVLDRELQPTELSFSIDADPSQWVTVGTGDGRTLFVTIVFDKPGDLIGTVVGFNLETGLGQVAVGPSTGFPYPPTGTRLSASTAANGLVAVSVAGESVAAEQDTLDGELLLIDFNQRTPVSYRLGHHRSGEGGGGFDTYWSASKISIDPNGDQLLFSSHFGQDRVDTFVIDVSTLRN